MKFGIAFANTGPFTQPQDATRFAQAAEAAGFESLWTVEHVVVPSDYGSAYPYSPTGKMPGADDMPIPDPLIWLAWVAAVTERIKLATGILILPQRNPVVLAKEVATLDAMSAGRLILGIGVGWLEEEFDAIGVPFGERGKRTDEYVAAMRSLWTQDKATFHGDFVNFDDCIMRPHPEQGSVPIHVGGHTDIAARRAGRLGDGYFPGKGSLEELARSFDIARAAAVEAGRDPSAIEMTTGAISLGGPSALTDLQALADVGVDRVMLPAFAFYREPEASLARYGEEVISRFG